LDRTAAERGLIVLGHGAGGGVDAPDLLAVTAAALDHQFSVARVEQPYRVCGRRSPAPAAALDAAWVAVVADLRSRSFPGLPVVAGGRSSGARVACRTAAPVGAAGVLCLAFPLLPPPRRGAARRAESRLPELDAVTAPTLVVQGERDRFGIPPPGLHRNVVTVAGDHSLRRDIGAISAAVTSWLAELDL
jgi:predicted alpha/beta-hydrolase family hydrolase